MLMGSLTTFFFHHVNDPHGFNAPHDVYINEIKPLTTLPLFHYFVQLFSVEISKHISQNSV